MWGVRVLVARLARLLMLRGIGVLVALLTVLLLWRGAIALTLLEFWRAAVLVVNMVRGQRRRWYILVVGMSLRVAGIILAEWLSVLAMLETTLLRRAERVGTSWWAIALRGVAILRSRGSLAIALLAVLALGRVALLAVSLLRILIVRVRHCAAEV